MSPRRVNRAHGLTVGDVIETNYTIRPYEITGILQSGPGESVTLLLRYADDPNDDKPKWINNVHFDGSEWRRGTSEDRVYRVSHSERTLQEELPGMTWPS